MAKFSKDNFEVFDPKRMLPFLGIGLIWSWIYCVFETPSLYPNIIGIGIDANPSWITWALSNTLALIAFAFCFKKEDLNQYRGIFWVGPTMMALGTIMSVYASINWMYLFSGILAGIGTAISVLCWSKALEKLDIEMIEIIIPLSFIPLPLFALLYNFLSDLFGLILVILLPIASYSLLQLSAPKGKTTKYEIETRKPDIPILSAIRTTLVLFVLYVILGGYDALSDLINPVYVHYGLDIATTLGTTVGIVTVLLFVLFARRVDLLSLFRFLIPVLIVSISLNASDLVSAKLVSKLLVVSIDMAVVQLSLIYIISTAKKLCLSSTFGVGIAHGGIILGLLIGELLGNEVQQAYLPDSSYYAIALVSICTVSCIVLLLPSSRKLLEFEKSFKIDAGEDNISALAAKYNLTNREKEVFEYLSKGYSRPYIREAMYLSKGTVSSHVEHIYTKLGIHSRDELMKILEEFEDIN